jgi:sugar phosphate isomerase/epimerase
MGEPMRATRRQFLAACAAAAAAGGTAVPPVAADDRRGAGSTGLGIIIHSYGIRRADKDSHFDDPRTFLDYCHALGAAGVQTALGVREEADAAKLRARAEEHKMYLEGSVRLPRDRGDVERFAAEVRTAKDCGASVVRTAQLEGRRYEVFDSAAAFRKFAEQGRQALLLAKPVVERHGVKLAVENHKDLEAGALVELLKAIDSPNVGACVDTGNNLSLLEPPLETVEALAPYAFSTHLKDLGVEEYADGFLMAEVPLGTGFLDLARVVEVLRKAKPAVRLNLEMITRDPLKVPCLTDKYWLTLEHVPGRRLAGALALVRQHAARKPLPRVSGLGRDERVKREDDNVRDSLRYAKERLSLSADK